MIISHRKRFIYFATPKCSSASVRKRLAHLVDRKHKNHFNPILKRKLMGQHVTYKEFLIIENGSYLSYYKFTFVRNPYDRIYSSFLQDIHASKTFESWKFFNAYLKKINFDFDVYLSDLQTGDLEMDWTNVNKRPAHLFSHNGDTCSMDFIGYVERFESDFFYLCRVLELDGIDLLTANINTEPMPECDPQNMEFSNYKYLDKYSSRSISIVNNIYAKDFQYLGYRQLNPSDF